MSELSIDEIMAYISLAGFVSAHLIAAIGEPTWMPKNIMALINWLAGNYAKAKNAPKP